MRTLFYDLETAPSLALVWGPDDQYIPPERLETAPYVLCWSAKFAGEKKIHSGVLDSDEAVEENDARIVADLAELIAAADLLVAHNIDKFDLPMMNARLLLNSLPPIGAIRTFDTLRAARNTFKLPYYRLDYLGKILTGQGKANNGGIDTWKRAFKGDEDALAKLLRYNRRDVVLLEQVYTAILPHVKGGPRLVNSPERVCPSCGGALVRWGFHYTQASTFQRWRCNVCFKVSRSRTSEPGKSPVVPI